MLNTENLATILLKYLHIIYITFAIPLVCIAITRIPPFQNPDEPNHFARAEQVSRFELTPKFVYDTAGTQNAEGDTFKPANVAPAAGGFVVDKGVYEAAMPFSKLAQNSTVKVTVEEFHSAGKIKWADGYALKNFANTAIYSPMGYLPQAIGIAIGKMLQLSVINTFYLARAFNALLALILGFITLRLAKRSKLLLFTALLFPMTISLFASVSQDTIVISCAFLLIAVIDNIESTPARIYSRAEIILLIVLMSVISLTKLPYMVFVIVFPFLRLSKRSVALGMTIPVILALGWVFLIANNFAIKLPEARDFSAKLQVTFILHNPLNFIDLFFQFDHNGITNAINSLIGILGWLDTVFPHSYYQVTYIVLIIATAITISLNFRDKLVLRGGLLLTSLIALAAILTTQYVTWTAVGANYLGGMQGRYLLPIFPFLALSLCLSTYEIKPSKINFIAALIILLFPLFTLIDLVNVLNGRYWG